MVLARGHLDGQERARRTSDLPMPALRRFLGRAGTRQECVRVLLTPRADDTQDGLLC